MRILLLARSFNSLTQRLHAELRARGHAVSVEFDIADSVTAEAVELWRPALVIAPFLRRRIAADVTARVPCLVVHPGPPGDRGPAALDWAIQRGLRRWGVTVLQAEAEYDAGPVWAWRLFDLPPEGPRLRKSSVYRNEVTEAATAAVLEAVGRCAARGAAGARLDEAEAAAMRAAVAQSIDVPLGWQPAMQPADRALDWARMDGAEIVRRIRAADGSPGVRDELFGVPCHLYDAHPAAWSGPATAPPGTVLARNHAAVLRATRDGAVWIGHVKRVDRAGEPGASDFKLPVALAFPDPFAALPRSDASGYEDLVYEEHGEEGHAVGVLRFPVYNGAFSTATCVRLTEAVRAALARPTRVLVLAGGPDFFCNGIHLHAIEAAASAADESMRNIEAMDDLCLALLTATDKLTVAALAGNAGAGGVFLALACDEVWARAGVVLNPHYKNMGNLYGSEYWTYTLPRRVRAGDPRAVMQERLPVGAVQARETGLVDAVLGEAAEVGPRFRGGDGAGCTPERFDALMLARATALAASGDWVARVAAKGARREADERERPLSAYRSEELARMRRNFYGFDPSYHVARAWFVRYAPPSWTPRHLALHRDGPGAAPDSG